MTLLLAGSVLGEDGHSSWEKPPRHWPNNRNVRLGEPGCWKPPGDGFSRREASKAVAQPLAQTLVPADRNFGDIPADLHIDGFVPLRLSAPQVDGRGATFIPCEVSIVHLGPRKVAEDEIAPEIAIKDFLLLTSRGKILWKWEMDATPAGAAANRYRLARIVTQFNEIPFVLLFCDTGANTRNYSYELYRVGLAGLEKVWTGYWEDGETGSMQQGYSWSNFDFSPLRTGRANAFTVYTTSGCRRWMLPGDEQYLKPRYTKRIFRWDANLGTFVTIAEQSFYKPQE